MEKRDTTSEKEPTPERGGKLVGKAAEAPLAARDAGAGPLEFVDTRPYRRRLEAARQASGRNDAVVTGIGKIEGRAAAVAVMDFNFMGGSMGVVVGEKLAQLIDHGFTRRLPLIVFSSSGGARMQE